MKESVSTDKAPAAIGPYSQAVKVGGLIFTSGQLPVNMENGNLEIDDIQKATEYCIKNLKAILEEAGSSLEKVIKVVVFIKDMNDFAKINEVYGNFFKENPPARSCVEVARLPKDARIEIEAIAELN